MKEKELPVVKIFIGSGEASVLERQTLIYSLQKHTDRKLEIYVFNGTHNSLESEDREPVLLDAMPLEAKYKNITEFSLYRFLIPELCKHQGKAIWMDSDIVCLSDIGELFDTDLGEHDFLACGDVYGKGKWTSSVMLIDCSKTKWSISQYMKEIKESRYSYTDLTQTTEQFLHYHPFSIGKLDPNWNVFDYADEKTKLIHYSDISTQPWKYSGHPFGDIWFDYFKEARAAGVLTEEALNKTMTRHYVRPDISLGNSPSTISKILFFFRRMAAKYTRPFRKGGW